MNKTSVATTVLVAISLVAVAYLYLHQSSDTALVTGLSAGHPTSSAEQTFINLAGELDPISFPTDIFSNPAFENLTDTRTALTPENAGRTDPFAPLSSGGQ